MWFFDCRIDGALVGGCLGEVGFQDGDVVTVVGERAIDGFEVSAVHRLADRTLWMHPHGGRGHQAYVKQVARWLIPLCLLVPMLAMLLTDHFSAASQGWTEHWVSGSILGVILAVAFLIPMYRLYPLARKATRAFAALGMDEPGQVDLYRAMRQPASQGKWVQKDYHPLKAWVYRY